MNMNEGYISDDDLQDLRFVSIGKNVKILKTVGIVGTENISIGNNVRIDDFAMIMASGQPCRTTGASMHRLFNRQINPQHQEIAMQCADQAGSPSTVNRATILGK